ncbi:MAG: toxin-activating lysine-acyltransferase [Pseudomonadales bacterium]
MKDTIVINPSLGTPHIPAQSLGSALWLWMHSPRHARYTVSELESTLLPAIDSGQFILVLQRGKPVFFIAWAFFDVAGEEEYRRFPDRAINTSAWSCGDRPWIVDFISPFGNTAELMRMIHREHLPDLVFRRLSRRRNDSLGVVTSVSGPNVTRAAAELYHQSHPLSDISQGGQPS